MSKITINKTTGAGTVTIPKEKLERLNRSKNTNVNLKITDKRKKLVLESDEE